MNKKTNEIETTVKNEVRTKVSLDQLIRKKLDKDDRRTATKEIYIESLDGNITFTNPSDSQRIEYSDKAKTKDYSDMIEGMTRLIYDCCPMLQSKELQESIDVSYPYDTVKAIFDIDEIMDIGVKLINFFENENSDENEDTEDKIKN